MNKLLRLLIAVILAVITAACVIPPKKSGYLYNFNNPTIEATQIALKQAQQQQQNFSIVMIGDSHIAGQLISQYLFHNLQQAFSLHRISPGWQPVSQISGQRSSMYQITNNKNVTVVSSFNRKFNDSEPLFGSFISKLGPNGRINYKPYSNNQKTEFNAQISVRCITATCDLKIDSDFVDKQIYTFNNNHIWQHLITTIAGNFSIASTSGIELGQLYLTHNQPSFINNVIGINGATSIKLYQQYLNYNWANQMSNLNPNIIIIALGSNDSYNTEFSLNQFNNWSNQFIQKLKQDHPKATIILLSTPEINSSIINKTNKNVSCQSSRRNTQNVYDAQYELAKQNNLLFWDWIAMTGGKCSRKKSIADGISAKDGIHFTINGYKLIAQLLSNDLIKIIK